MIKKIIVPIFLLLLISGCMDKSPSVSNTIEDELKLQIDQLEIKNKQLQNQISQIEIGLEEEKDALRTTMNLVFSVFKAMNNKDFEYIKSISSSTVQVNENDDEIYFSHTNNSHKITNNKYLLDNLEYRYYHLEDNNMTIGFAEYFFEGHSTIYFGFIKQDGEWLLDSIVTDA